MEAQLLTWSSAPPILLAATSQATSLSTGLAKAAIRAMMPFSLLTPSASRLKDSIHSGDTPEAMISDGFLRFHIAPIQPGASRPLVSIRAL